MCPQITTKPTLFRKKFYEQRLHQNELTFKEEKSTFSYFYCLLTPLNGPTEKYLYTNFLICSKVQGLLGLRDGWGGVRWCFVLILNHPPVCANKVFFRTPVTCTSDLRKSTHSLERCAVTVYKFLPHRFARWVHGANQIQYLSLHRNSYDFCFQSLVPRWNGRSEGLIVTSEGPSAKPRRGASRTSWHSEGCCPRPSTAAVPRQGSHCFSLLEP